MTCLVIDLSHHNTIPGNLQPAWDFGVRGLIHKATEGISFVDSKLESRYILCRETKMLWGVYHFIRPGDIKEQVAHFLETCLPVIDPETLFACDYEDAGVPLDDVLTFMEIVHKETKAAPVLYSGHVLKEKMEDDFLEPLTHYRLWLAQYSSTAVLPKGWGEYWLWQYSETGSVPGINPPTDLNKYDYNEEDLRIEWNGREEDLSPPIPPEDLVVRVIAPKGVEVIVEREK